MNKKSYGIGLRRRLTGRYWLAMPGSGAKGKEELSSPKTERASGAGAKTTNLALERSWIAVSAGSNSWCCKTMVLERAWSDGNVKMVVFQQD